MARVPLFDSEPSARAGGGQRRGPEARLPPGAAVRCAGRRLQPFDCHLPSSPDLPQHPMCRSHKERRSAGEPRRGATAGSALPRRCL
eukprot:3514015-Pyramimonas_sp.AAC.1